MRCFVAVVPPADALEDLDAFLDVRRASGDFRWTPEDQIHLTLAFCEEVADRHLDELLERLERAAARRTRFATRIAGGGAFPNVSDARVLWAGLELDEDARTEVGRLADGCRAAASRTGIAVAGQRFRPHLTVARVRRPTEMTPWVRLLDAYAGPPWTADSISLVQSHLGEGPRNRPRYQVLAELPLGPSDAGAAHPDGSG
ncbi:RNA 2',3'-cyclic phosphodiesterase [Nocardioides sp. 616]|uniref:RNA 2',3'-cyclic phosphodiesterase n=1 Tax=Nocardioides sp. 616 TaxID=2268090 RepID=UPI000CE3D210|nr:RNA 2',3'-cyclic phosphodiesterase [Nocardioides sp. 616]